MTVVIYGKMKLIVSFQMSGGRRSQANMPEQGLVPPGGVAGAGAGEQAQRVSTRRAILRTIESVADEGVLARLTFEQATIKARFLAQHWARWQEQHHQLMGVGATAAILAAAEQINAELEQQVMDTMARIDALIYVRQQERLPVAVAAPAAPAQAIIVRHHREPKVGTFDGRHENWAAFYDLFRVEVDGREDLDPLEKLVHLKNACIGRGAKALGDWPTIAANYPIVWAALQGKYHDPYVMKNRLITDVQRMARQQQETYDGLRTLIDTPMIALKQLEGMGENVAHWDLQIMNTILYKAPLSVVEAWERHRAGREPTLEEMFEWLERRAKIQMATETVQSNRNRGTGRRQDNGQSGRRPGNGQPPPDQGRQTQDNGQLGRPASDDQAGPNQDNGQPGATVVKNDGETPKKGNEPHNQHRGGCRSGPIQCWVCSGEHSMYACHKLLALPLDGRIAMMREHGVCLECGMRHKGDCRKPRQCILCDNMNHTELACPKRAGTNGGENRKRKM